MRLRYITPLLFLCASFALAQDCTQTANRCVGMPGTNGTEYATPQAAADDLVAGDTLYIGSGNWAGFHMTAGHAVGTSSSRITISCQSGATINSADSSGHGIYIQQVPYVTIQGCTIPVGSSCIKADESIGYWILDNICIGDDTQRSRILTGFGHRGSRIERNHTSHAGQGQHGIYVSNSDDPLDSVVVRGNESDFNAGAGIQFNGDFATLNHLGQSDGMISGFLAEGNNLHDNVGAGFSVINGSDGVIRNNIGYNVRGSAYVKLADQGLGTGSNRNQIVNNTMVASTTHACVRVVSGSDNEVWNNLCVNDVFDCVLDAGTVACTNGGADSNNANRTYFQAGYKRTLAQAASGVFTNYSTHDLTLVSGSGAISIGSTSFNGFVSPPIDYLGNARPNGAYDVGAYEFGASSAGSDTTAPTAPGTPTGVITPYSVALSWTASTDAREVLWYYILRDGAVIGFSGTTTYTDTTVVAGTTYSYTIEAIDGSSNLSSASGALSAPIPGIAGCLNADTTWRYRPLPTLTGSFELSADVTPFTTTTNNGTLGFGPGIPAAYTQQGIIVRFQTGVIDVRNGGTYSADASISYTLGTAYHLRMPVNVTNHTYSVYVTPAGGSETLLAANYAFRSEQSAAASLGYAGVFDDSGSISACNLSINGVALDSMTFQQLTPALTGTSYTIDAEGSGKPVLNHSAIQTLSGTSLTLTGAMCGNQILRLTANSAVTLTVPLDLENNLACTFVQLGTGTVALQAQSGVTLIQRQNLFHTAGRGSPVTIQSTGNTNEYVVWGDLQ